MIALPRRPRGRPTADAEAAYQSNLVAFCEAIKEINSSLDFKVSSRGWCYILEEYGLVKGDFDNAQELIVDCRKSGLLPIGIVAEDGARKFDNLEFIDDHDPDIEAENIVALISTAHEHYNPHSFWEFQDCYIEMVVEKIDLKSLFAPICEDYHVPLANARGWSDLNMRAAMMWRFAEHEAEGRTPILLYCGDHDPGGLQISDTLKSNLDDLSAAVGWSPDDLIIERFGLNYDFIDHHDLTWIDNLETGSGKRLDDPRHHLHNADYVQDYLARFGARKVEANALVVRPEAGRDLCREAIEQYIDTDRVDDYRQDLKEQRQIVADEVIRLLADSDVGGPL